MPEKTSRHIFVIMSIVSVSKLHLFGKPSIQTTIEHTTEKDHYHLSSMIESGRLEFTITGSGDEYLDLSSAYLHLTASISVAGVTTPTKTTKQHPSTTRFKFSSHILTDL